MLSLVRTSARRRWSTGQWPSPRVFSHADSGTALRCCLVPIIEYVNTIRSEPTGTRRVSSVYLEKKRVSADGSFALWECLNTRDYYRKMETRKVKGTTDFNRNGVERYIDLEPLMVCVRSRDHEIYAQ